MAEKKKKSFWDTKVGSLLSTVAPAAVNVIGDAIPGGQLLKSVFNQHVMQDDGRSPEEKELAKQQFEAALREYEIKERQMLLDDMANARDMQKSALAQGDLFSKRFIYYLAAFIMLGLMAMLVMLFYIEIPDGNNEIVYMAIGIFMGIATSVAAFFFGSSQGSKDKEHGMLDAMKGRRR
jgi:hypothetical protein